MSQRRNRRAGLLKACVACSLWVSLALPLVADEELDLLELEMLREDKGEMIRLRMQRDMMYGSDDYFGENTDLSYVDGVTPTVPEPEPEVIETAPPPAETTQDETPTESRRREETRQDPPQQEQPQVEEPPQEEPPEEEPPEEEPPLFDAFPAIAGAKVWHQKNPAA